VIQPWLAQRAHAVKYQKTGMEDPRSAVATLRERVGDRDVIYVHPSMAEQVKLYLSIYQWTPPDVIIGTGSWPCCVTGQDWVMRSPGPEALVEDFRHAADASRSGTVWFVRTGRDDHWTYSRLDEPAVLLDALPGIGCTEVERIEHHNVDISEIQCRGQSGFPE
jgi:hypothetical protein